MPILDIKEIQALVKRDEIAALTLDTSIFDQFGCNLDFRSLTALEQFKNTDVHVLLSRITVEEVKGHLARDARESAEKARAGINQFNKAWQLGLDLVATLKQLGIGRDPAQRAAELMDAYMSRIGAKLVDVEPDVSVRELVRLYFSAEPPFSSKAAKKSEFPDAIALLSLEAWARRRGSVLVVSKDKDWAAFAAASDNLILVTDLKQALNLFNAASSVVAKRVATLYRSGDAPALVRALERALERHVEEFNVEATADFIFEDEPIHSALLRWNLADGSDFDVVDSDEDSVSLGIDIELEAEFRATFSFSVRDSIDKDYIPMGSTRPLITEMLTVPILITLPKEMGEDPEPEEVQVEQQHPTIDFGHVEPDWYHERD